MTFESHTGGNSENREANLALKMQIQRALIEHSCGPDEDFEEHGLEWIMENSENFQMIFDEMVRKNPNLKDVWDESAVSVLDAIHGELFKMKEAKKAA